MAGAYAALEERGYEPQNVAGTSAGAITAALIAAGYSAAELREIIFDLDFRQFKDQAWEDRIPLVGRRSASCSTRASSRAVLPGLDARPARRRRASTTFAELEDRVGRPEVPLSAAGDRLRRHARQLLVLPRDAGELGIEPDELDVAYAVRMSMSIPIFFEPVRIENPRDGHEHLIVDGGMLSNFPVWLFDCAARAPDWPTFGLLLVEPDPKVPIGTRCPRPSSADGRPRARRAALGHAATR